MDANSGAPWSEADISDLKNELDHGRTIAETASFLCRDVYELRATMKELGLTEQPGKRRASPASRFRSSHHCAAHSFAKFGIKGTLAILNLF